MRQGPCSCDDEEEERGVDWRKEGFHRSPHHAAASRLARRRYPLSKTSLLANHILGAVAGLDGLENGHRNPFELFIVVVDCLYDAAQPAQMT